MKKKNSSPKVAPGSGWSAGHRWPPEHLPSATLSGRNLRARYLMSRRTPYDFYSHAGDNGNGIEYGVGI